MSLGLLLAAAVSAVGSQPPSPPTLASATAAAGASPIAGDAVYLAFHGKAGIDRIVADLIRQVQTDPRITDIFKASDLVRLQTQLSSQICFLLDGPCLYDGKTMKASHKDLGLQDADLNALVEDLQNAMDREGVPFRAQNRLLAKLAPMRKDVVVR
ncbi:MAG: group I truncated hemoglobin [Caulobacteraceae bacterium]